MDIAYVHKSMSTRVSTSGTVDVDAGSWLIEVSCTNGETTIVRSSTEVGPGTFNVPDVDTLLYRQADARTIHTVLSVREDVSGSWIRRSIERYQEPMQAQPAYSAKPIGLHLFPSAPGADAIARPEWEAELDAMPAGVDCLRLGLAWYGLQPTAQSTWDETKASHFDAVFADLNTRGHSIGITCGTTPPWAGADQFGPATDMTNVAQWIDDIIDRWGGVIQIDFIDPWNEPDLTLNGTMADVAAMVAAAHDGAAGRVPIAIPPLSGVKVADLDAMVAGGLTNADFEILDLHPYPLSFEGAGFHWLNPSIPVNDLIAERMWTPLAGVHTALEWLDKHGFTADITVSEVGVGVARHAPGSERVIDARSAQWLSIMVDQLRRCSEVTWINIHEAADRSASTETGWSSGWGLIDIEGNRRKKWQTYTDSVSLDPLTATVEATV